MRSIFFVLWAAVIAWAQSPPAWVAKSNQNSQLLVAILARYAPEAAASEGVPGLDEQITMFPPEQSERFRRDLAVARIELQKRFAEEKNPLVRQDLEILIGEADRNIKSSEADERNLLPYEDVAGTIFFGMQSLLDDQITADRRPAAVVRLLKYTGLLEGFEPLTVQAEAALSREIANTRTDRASQGGSRKESGKHQRLHHRNRPAARKVQDARLSGCALPN